ncbi:hypothetical protein [Streptomyces sp. NPDC001070]
MSSPPVVARPEWSVVEAARLMKRRGVERARPWSTGRTAGQCGQPRRPAAALPARDRAIREEITGDLLVKTLGLSPNAVTVHVVDGKVSSARRACRTAGASWRS